MNRAIVQRALFMAQRRSLARFFEDDLALGQAHNRVEGPPLPRKTGIQSAYQPVRRLFGSKCEGRDVLRRVESRKIDFVKSGRPPKADWLPPRRGLGPALRRSRPWRSCPRSHSCESPAANGSRTTREQTPWTRWARLERLASWVPLGGDPARDGDCASRRSRARLKQRYQCLRCRAPTNRKPLSNGLKHARVPPRGDCWVAV